ncbi:MAG: class II aldolase/adducin family protein [Eubacteriales bacterium]|nr:class II aldolase/adducin family protein [Eubacteriales bacterium]
MNNEKKARKRVAEYCRRLYEKGFMPGIDGNVSVRVDSDTAIVTPAGLSKETITPGDLVCMKLTGEVISGSRQPSSETPMHLAAYRLRHDIGAVIHAHSPNATAFALCGKHIDTRYAPFAYMHLGVIGDVPYDAPGTPEFHQSVTAAVKKGYNVIMFKNHGAMVLGANLPDAYAKTDLLEAYAGMLLKAELLGGASVLSDKQLEKIVHG